MKDRVNKPRAFLSYASPDITFIERIEKDLQTCQIDTWRDRKDIRDGQPWMESIFEEGLPTCDVIIAYFTENSLNSDMVAKEVDAAQLRQLKDSGVSFLPYVQQSETRPKLRLDIQVRQCRVWNDNNYHEVLPSVVGEIWRSYMERNLARSLLQERNRRLELEIELQKLTAQSNASGFTPQEEKEFPYIFNKLDKPRELTAHVYSERFVGTLEGKYSFLKNLLSFMSSGHTVIEGSVFDAEASLQSHVLDNLRRMDPSRGYVSVELKEKPRVELSTYGFVEPKDNLVEGIYRSYQYAVTSKLYRFKFWLEVNDLTSETPLFEVEPEQNHSNPA